MGGQTNLPLDSEFQEKVNEALTHFNVPGIAVAVVHNDKIYANVRYLPSLNEADGLIFSNFYSGLRACQITFDPSHTQTLFYTGSTTKAFTAAVFSSLADDKEKFSPLQWTTPISEIIRNVFVIEDVYLTRHVTFEDALCHPTCMARHDLACGTENSTSRDTVRSLQYLPLTAPLRTKFQYCDPIWVTVPYAVEYLTGEWIGDVIRKRIWEPLGMIQTSLKVDHTTENLSQGYCWDPSSESYNPVSYLDFSVFEGVGGVISNVMDYSAWLRVMIYASPPISPAGHATIAGSHSIVADTSMSTFTGCPQGPFINVETYGYGWWRRVYRNHLVIYHTGGVTGYRTFILCMGRGDDGEWRRDKQLG